MELRDALHIFYDVGTLLTHEYNAYIQTDTVDLKSSVAYTKKNCLYVLPVKNKYRNNVSKNSDHPNGQLQKKVQWLILKIRQKYLKNQLKIFFNECSAQTRIELTMLIGQRNLHKKLTGQWIL